MKNMQFMKKIFTLITALVLVCSCSQNTDKELFIKEMYEQKKFEDYAFLEKHCTKDLLAKLASEYDYEGEGYAVWKFRSAAQDGPSDESRIISIQDEGDGWYRYTASDMGIAFSKRILLLDEGGRIVIADLSDGCRRISPLPSGIDIDNLQDCTVPASFNSDNFDWMGGNLTMCVFSRDLYDAVEISQMKVGDTLLYESKPMIVSKIAEVNGTIEINGGLEEGGCWIAGNEGGTFVAREWDDHATYTKLGTAEVALTEDFVIIDCGLEPNSPIDTICSGQKLYLENLKDSRREFSTLNTLVTIEKGMITMIRRVWIP